MRSTVEVQQPLLLNRRKLLEVATPALAGFLATMATSGCVPSQPRVRRPLPGEIPPVDPLFRELAQKYMGDVPRIVKQSIKEDHYRNGIVFIPEYFRRNINRRVVAPEATADIIGRYLQNNATSELGKQLLEKTGRKESNFAASFVLLKGVSGDNVFSISTHFEDNGILSGYDIEYAEFMYQKGDVAFIDPRISAALLGDLAIVGIPRSIDPEKLRRSAVSFFEHFFTDAPVEALGRQGSIEPNENGQSKRMQIEGTKTYRDGRTIILAFHSEGFFRYSLQEPFYTLDDPERRPRQLPPSDPPDLAYSITLPPY